MTDRALGNEEAARPESTPVMATRRPSFATTTFRPNSTLIAASGLWNRVRLVWLTTALAMVGYSILATDAYLQGLPVDGNHHPDILLTALAVTGLIIA